jgi:nucleotide-binding universal stress UspA family protein
MRAKKSLFDADQRQQLQHVRLIAAPKSPFGGREMKSLMLHVAQDEGFDGRLQAALDLARRVEGHLTLVQPAMTQDFVAMDMAGGAHFVAQAYEIANQARAEQKARVEAGLAHEGVNWDWQVVEGGARTAMLADAARLADLAILSLDADRRGSGQPGRSLVGDLALNCRTPVLAIPPGCKGFGFGTAVIAYDGGPEASFALRCAAPLLSEYNDVVIAEVSAEPATYPLTDAANYLARRGIKARIESIGLRDETIEEQLLAAASQVGAELMVMGAYSHSRWREALFGGVTHYVLAETKVPILLAH